MGIAAIAALAVGLVSIDSGACRTVVVCVNPGANASLVVRAQGYAQRLFEAAGVRLRWEGDVRRCAGGIVISLAENAPRVSRSGALAYALPYEGRHIVVFYDRVRAAVPPNGVPVLLAHVMAHEIVHMLQGVARHSERGLMKERWEYADYVEMQRRPLRLDAHDLRLIERGLTGRGASK